jgi:hypothetical protein
MPKRHKTRRKGGGWFDDLKNSTSSFNPSSWTSGLSTSSWNPFAKKEVPSYASPSTTYEPPIQSAPIQSAPIQSTPIQSTPIQSYSVGGKKRRSRRCKRGGSYSPNMSQTNLAASASPVSGIQTVKAQTWVGGKTKKRHHRRNKKSRKHH